MKLTTIALAIAFTLPSTFALARGGMALQEVSIQLGFRFENYAIKTPDDLDGSLPRRCLMESTRSISPAIRC